ncbi:IS481 family transposase, partial [Serratia sp. N21D137]
AAEYDEGVLVRKVDVSGKLSLKGMGLKVGKAFIGEYVGLKESEREGYYEVWWYSTKVGMIDLRSRSIIMGKGC